MKRTGKITAVLLSTVIAGSIITGCKKQPENDNKAELPSEETEAVGLSDREIKSICSETGSNFLNELETVVSLQDAYTMTAYCGEEGAAALNEATTSFFTKLHSYEWDTLFLENGLTGIQIVNGSVDLDEDGSITQDYAIMIMPYDEDGTELLRYDGTLEYEITETEEAVIVNPEVIVDSLNEICNGYCYWLLDTYVEVDSEDEPEPTPEPTATPTPTPTPVPVEETIAPEDEVI